MKKRYWDFWLAVLRDLDPELFESEKARERSLTDQQKAEIGIFDVEEDDDE